MRYIFHLSTAQILLFIIYTDLQAHLGINLYGVCNDTREEYFECLKRAFSTVRLFESHTLPWFAFIIQNTDIIFWVADVVRDLLLISDINGILLNLM